MYVLTLVDLLLIFDKHQIHANLIINDKNHCNRVIKMQYVKL